jgi:NAD(P)-dependent dehydrogenase (short-subunit alcohol dehydrogenase family)
MKRLEGKTAIVTGAGRGIGRGIAIAYAREGANVVVASRTKSSIDATVSTIQAEGGDVIGVTCDVGRRDEVFTAVAKTVAAFGTVDILVNNAQGFGTERRPTGTPRPIPLEDFDEEEWEYTFRTGVLATLWGMKAVFPWMKGRGGKIINFGSWLGQIGGEGTAAYNATKEAIRALSRTAAREWGKYRINVNVINPAVATDAMRGYFDAHPEQADAMLAQVPLRRWGDAVKDAGGLAIFLASSDADYLTGMTFQLDGGASMHA